MSPETFLAFVSQMQEKDDLERIPFLRERLEGLRGILLGNALNFKESRQRISGIKKVEIQELDGQAGILIMIQGTRKKLWVGIGKLLEAEFSQARISVADEIFDPS